MHLSWFINFFFKKYSLNSCKSAKIILDTKRGLLMKMEGTGDGEGEIQMYNRRGECDQNI
jgi:hypothetical protein